MTYREAYDHIRAKLEAADIEEAAVDSRLLLEYVSGLSRARYLLVRENEMPDEQLARLLELCGKREKREPLQYITGSQEFMGLPFKCTADCLIPRQDTELLVLTAMEEVDRLRKKGIEPRVLDLCTGTGCIIISLAKLAGLKKPVASDISVEALRVACENAQNNGIAVEFVQSDLFTDISGRFELITANPPYIESGTIPGLMPEVCKYEPMLALDGGEDGLSFYRRILKQVPDYLCPEGRLIVEIGDGQGESVPALFENAGFKEVKVLRDLTDYTRVVEGHL